MSQDVLIKFDLTASIVAYKNDAKLLNHVIGCFSNTALRNKIIVSDNSPDDSIGKQLDLSNGEYIFNKANLGFGKAHNICISSIINSSKYHLVLNPDISFPPGTLEKLFDYMEARPEVGLVLPMVLNEEKQIQHLCKRLPTPGDLILRRFLPKVITSRLTGLSDRYLMQDKDYHQVFEAPSLSGCFMFFRTSALKHVGLFDERYFMYMEDIDISRRMHSKYSTVYYPKVHVIHGHARESYKINKLLFVHIMSALKYFNKWGWFFDKERKDVNSKI